MRENILLHSYDENNGKFEALRGVKRQKPYSVLRISVSVSVSEERGFSECFCKIAVRNDRLQLLDVFKPVPVILSVIALEVVVISHVVEYVLDCGLYSVVGHVEDRAHVGRKGFHVFADISLDLPCSAGCEAPYSHWVVNDIFGL